MVLAEPSSEATTHATVLIIDDDEEDLKYWSDTVRNFASNYTVLKAQDSKSGLAICRERTVDCVLLDLDMPESGFQVLFNLIPDRKRPEIAVVILTRMVHPILPQIATHNAALAYLVKQQTSAEELATVIQRAISSVKSTQ